MDLVIRNYIVVYKNKELTKSEPRTKTHEWMYRTSNYTIRLSVETLQGDAKNHESTLRSLFYKNWDYEYKNLSNSLEDYTLKRIHTLG